MDLLLFIFTRAMVPCLFALLGQYLMGDLTALVLGFLGFLIADKVCLVLYVVALVLFRNENKGGK